MAPQYIPAGWKSTPEINRLFAKEHPNYIRLLRQKAQKASCGGLLEYDDILQDIQMAMLYALSRHNPQRGSKLKWIGFICDNCIKMFLQQAYAQSRLPRVWEPDGQGGWEKKTARPTSIEDAMLTPNGIPVHDNLVDLRSPERIHFDSEDRRHKMHTIKRFRGLMEARLDGFALELFRARRGAGPLALYIYIRNITGRYPENPAKIRAAYVARYYGISPKRVSKAHSQIRLLTKDLLVSWFTAEQIDELISEEIEVWQ